jgi:hypothetical protein
VVSIDKIGPGQSPDMERLSLGDKCLFHQVSTGRPRSARWLVEPELTQVPAAGSIAPGRIPSISDIVIAFTALTSGIGCYVFFDRVLCEPARENQLPPKQTLIFEHPEDGIHPGALALLAEEFKAAPEQGHGQVILTTHSPKLLDHFDVEQIRVVELAGLETRIGFISAEQKEAIRDRLLEPGELLTVDPARMQLETTDA